MKALVLGGVLLAVVGSSFAGSAVCSGKWSVTCGKGTVKTIDTNGSARLTGTTVTAGTDVNGHFHALSSQLQNVEVKGAADIEKTAVSGNVTVDGNASLYKANIAGNLTVNGNSTINNSTIGGKTKLNGTFAASHSHFKGPITVNTPTINFESTTATDITVGKAFSMVPFYHPKVYLEHDSVVTGNITFTGGKKGIVYVNKGSKFTGKVISGVAYQEKNNV